VSVSYINHFNVQNMRQTIKLTPLFCNLVPSLLYIRILIGHVRCSHFHINILVFFVGLSLIVLCYLCDFFSWLCHVLLHGRMVTGFFMIDFCLILELIKPRDHPCQVWFNLVQQFQRRRFKCDLLSKYGSWLPTNMATKLEIEKRGDDILIVHCCFSISQNELKF
jgi:hypothetical protein